MERACAPSWARMLVLAANGDARHIRRLLARAESIIKFAVAFHEAQDAKVLHNASSTRGAKPCAQIWIVGEAEDGGGKAFGVACRDYQAGFAIDHSFCITANVCHHH